MPAYPSPVGIRVVHGEDSYIVREGLGKLGAPAITVSDRGLRHGLLIERFGAGPPPAADAPIAPGSRRD